MTELVIKSKNGKNRKILQIHDGADCSFEESKGSRIKIVSKMI